jgi:hypothetical protein
VVSGPRFGTRALVVGLMVGGQKDVLQSTPESR